MQTVTSSYLDGIAEGREYLNKYGADDAAAHVANLEACCREFGPSNPVGQLYRGERDFWRNQLKKAKRA